MENVKTSKWIILDWDSHKIQRNKTIHGHDVKMFLSPYDVPEAVRTILDPDKKEFILEFRYLNEEPTDEKVISSFVKVMLGKSSKRLYSARFDLDVLLKETPKITKYDKIIGTIYKFAQESATLARKDNYELALDAIKEKKEKLDFFLQAA